jgi:thiol-disulfide isomerase/thioredoxin
MMDAYTTWCGPCKMMDKMVFTNDTVADYFNANFIAYKADMEKGEGLELAKRFEVRAYPNFLFIAPDGSVIHRSVGARPPHKFVAVGRDALNPEKQYAFYQKKYEAGDRSPEFMGVYASMKGELALDNSKELSEYFALQKDADLLTRKNWNMLANFTRSTEAPQFKRFMQQREAFNKAYTKDSVDMFILGVYGQDLAMLKYRPDAAKESKLQAELTKLNVKDSNRLLWALEAEKYKSAGDFKSYGVTAAKLVDSYHLNDPGMLNNYAWAFYENVSDKKLLAKAADWSGKAVALYPDYAFMDTHAAVLYKLGKKKEAQAAAEKAIAAGKKTGQDVADTEALLKKINTLK